MGLIDRFLNAIKLNDDFDDEEDFLDDEDDLLDEEDDDLSRTRTRGRFFSKFRDEEDDDPDDEEELIARPVRKEERGASSASRTKGRSSRSSASAKAGSSRTTASRASSRSSQYGSSETARSVYYASRQSSRDTSAGADARKKQQKVVTPIRNKKNVLANMEVNVIRPSSMEDASDIADTLMQSCTVVLNLEGLDNDIAQRVVDFSCGVCYSLHGNLQKISGYIFILTPENVELSGDFQSILSGAFDIAPMRSGF